MLKRSEGDISAALKSLSRESAASDRILFKGWKNAGEMQKMASEATLGIHLLVSESKSLLILPCCPKQGDEGITYENRGLLRVFQQHKL